MASATRPDSPSFNHNLLLYGELIASTDVSLRGYAERCQPSHLPKHTPSYCLSRRAFSEIGRTNSFYRHLNTPMIVISQVANGEEETKARATAGRKFRQGFRYDWPVPCQNASPGG